MPLYTKKQFAETCSVSEQYVNEYIKRGKIVIDGELIDDSILPNSTFIRKRLQKNSEPSPKEKINNSEQSQPETKIGRRVVSSDSSDYPLSPIDVLKGKNLEIRNRLLEEKINKILGESIPLAEAQQAGQTSFKNCAIAFRNILEKRLTRWSKKFTPEEMAKERSETLRELNQAINNAVDESKKSIAEIISISSNKKEVGERE